MRPPSAVREIMPRWREKGCRDALLLQGGGNASGDWRALRTRSRKYDQAQSRGPGWALRFIGRPPGSQRAPTDQERNPCVSSRHPWRRFRPMSAIPHLKSHLQGFATISHKDTKCLRRGTSYESAATCLVWNSPQSSPPALASARGETAGARLVGADLASCRQPAAVVQACLLLPPAVLLAEQEPSQRHGAVELEDTDGLRQVGGLLLQRLGSGRRFFHQPRQGFFIHMATSRMPSPGSVPARSL